MVGEDDATGENELPQAEGGGVRASNFPGDSGSYRSHITSTGRTQPATFGYRLGKKAYLSRSWLNPLLRTDPWVEIIDRKRNDAQTECLYKVKENGQVLRNAQGEEWVPEAELDG